MEKRSSEYEMAKHANLLHKVIRRKKDNKRMQVIEIGVAETNPNSNAFYVYCKLKGDLGEVTETLTYVLANYTV